MCLFLPARIGILLFVLTELGKSKQATDLKFSPRAPFDLQRRMGRQPT
jgi:hypothetical protein